jgi:hypothetical protein
MSFSSKILPAVAFAVALSPLAAQARNIQPGPAQHNLAPRHAATVMVGSATIDNPTTVYSGWIAQKFPTSVGG